MQEDQRAVRGRPSAHVLQDVIRQAGVSAGKHGHVGPRGRMIRGREQQEFASCDGRPFASRLGALGGQAARAAVVADHNLLEKDLEGEEINKLPVK